MARREKTSSAEDLMDLVAMLSWWAVVIWKGLANPGQYILPILCLAGACVSAWRRQERQRLVAAVLQSKASDALDVSPAWAASAPAGQPSAAPMQASSSPVCLKSMVRRTAERGANAGGEFWVCTGYPACRVTRPIG